MIEWCVESLDQVSERICVFCHSSVVYVWVWWWVFQKVFVYMGLRGLLYRELFYCSRQKKVCQECFLLVMKCFVFWFLFSLYHKRNGFGGNKEKFVIWVCQFVESCIICFIFVIERRRDKMFNNGERFYYLSRNVARQQKIIKMYKVFLRSISGREVLLYGSKQ